MNREVTYAMWLGEMRSQVEAVQEFKPRARKDGVCYLCRRSWQECGVEPTPYGTFWLCQKCKDQANVNVPHAS